MGLSVAAMIALPGIGGILLSCLIDGTLVDMFTAIATGDWTMLGLSLLTFIPGAKAVKGLKAVGGVGKAGKATGKGIDVYRYVDMTEAKNIKKSGKIASKNPRGTFVTTYETGSVTDALVKTKPTSNNIPVARAHAKISLSDYRLGPLTEMDIVDPSVTQYLLQKGPELGCIDLIWLGL